MYTGMAGYDVFAKYPVIGAYRERVRNEMGAIYEETHKAVRMVTTKFKGVPKLSKL